MIDKTRRRLMLGMTGLLAAGAGGAAAALMPTPRQTAGPFYPVELPLDDDNNLTEVAGIEGEPCPQRLLHPRGADDGHLLLPAHLAHAKMRGETRPNLVR